MDTGPGRLARVASAVHHNFLWLLVGAYALAAVAPAPGLWLRSVRVGGLSLPSLMLALLLFNAGLGVRADRLRGLLHSPFVLFAGLVANLAVPLLFVLGVSQTLSAWHNPNEVQSILVGLALVGSMPIAGSSTAWSQNANGDLALSLGLVVLSTCLSPLTTPAVLHAAGWVAVGPYAEGLRTLAAGGTSVFLAAFVMLPSLGGIAARAAVGEQSLSRATPALKLVNSVSLLALCYSNAALALPDAVFAPDWDYLAVMLAIVVALCVTGFVGGWAVAKLLRTDGPRETALMFGLGMNNNGTGLVLAAAALSNLPEVLLPVIFYNLVQHFVAAAVDRLRFRQEEADEPAP